MRFSVLFLSLVVVVVMLVSGCGGSANGGSDENRVKQLFNKQQRNWSSENWRDLYQSYSPQFREQCSYDQFLGNVRSATQAGVNLGDVGFDNLVIAVDGDTARLTYIETYQGKDISAVTESSPDLYTRIDGIWYDDIDAHTKCR